MSSTIRRIDEGEKVLTGICNREDSHLLVSEFSRRTFMDQLPGPVFIDVVRMDLEKHMPIMCVFWEAVLLRLSIACTQVARSSSCKAIRSALMARGIPAKDIQYEVFGPDLWLPDFQ
ncbi:hypothetical protein IV500_16870 [Paeniglutamicibacter antarcticus]|uniref:Uncharacterized protein n=1 Tax=Arthrobacter terrae TaxID=2935737 RepID=A0A931CQ88_9MICC|nr:hypothetical protein [Arthrobacter terrae]MBG0741047.1 hypothetical protein [Arthrobacter terrae]